MFKLLYALNVWVIDCTPNPGRSFQHWPGQAGAHVKYDFAGQGGR